MTDKNELAEQLQQLLDGLEAGQVTENELLDDFFYANAHAILAKLRSADELAEAGQAALGYFGGLGMIEANRLRAGNLPLLDADLLVSTSKALGAALRAYNTAEAEPLDTEKDEQND